MVPDLRNNIKTDLRQSLKTDLRVQLTKAKRPIQDLRSRLSRPRAADQTDTEEEEYLYKRRADTEEDVEEEDLFTRKSDEGSHLIHVSDVHEEDINSSRDLKSKEIKEYSSEGSAPYENIKRTIKNKKYYDRPLDDFVGDRYRRLEPNHGTKEREATRPRTRRPCPSTKKERQRNLDLAEDAFQQPNDPKNLKRSKMNDSDENPGRRRRHRRRTEEVSDADSDDLRPAKKDSKSPLKRKEVGKNRKTSSGEKELRLKREDPDFKIKNIEEVIHYMEKQQINDGEIQVRKNHGMPINEEFENQCPVPQCKASNQPMTNRDTPDEHRFVTNCPKLKEMSPEMRWAFYKKAKSTCTNCFSTDHKFQKCPMQLAHSKPCKVKLDNGEMCGGAHHKYLHVDSHI